MGEVYRARDTQLGRDVAIKVLPDSVVGDTERIARFEREAQLLAALNHPNIAAIYGMEKHALILELVEGPTLSELISSNRTTGSGLPFDDTVAIAAQISLALEAAHEQGIIHRDLKPANIKVRPDGTVKVLDFGLAKALETSSGARPSSVSMSPTLTAPTQLGTILGTAAYMAPEQARGKAVDKRADIWAFGCVLYEMLAGRRAFGGEEVSDTLAYVITKDVDWTALPPTTPASVRRLLRRCLEKDPKRRLRDAADLRLDLQDSADPSTTSAPAPSLQASRFAPTAAGAIGAVVVASLLTGSMMWLLIRPTPVPPAAVQRFPISVPASAPWVGENGGELAISPDGTSFVYVALEGGTRMLYQRRLDQLDPQPIRGTEDAYNPFFSPDGDWIGFFSGGGSPNGKLKKIPVRGGAALTLADTTVPTGAWLADDTILFTRSTGAGAAWVISRIPAAGGEATLLTTPDAKERETRHAWPEPLPGSKAILFSISVGGAVFDESRIAVLSLETGQYRTIVEQGYHARYVSTGHIVYILSGNLMSVPFDVNRLETTGPPIPIVEGIRGRINTGDANFAVSRTGFLIYAPGGTGSSARRSLVWVDRDGREQAITAPPRAYTYPRLSPDGTRVALDVRDQNGDIWIWDLARQNLTRLTFEPGADQYPLWAPDGRRIFFSSARGSNRPQIFSQAADGSGQAEQLVEGAYQRQPQAITPDGKQLLFRESDPKTAADIGGVSLADRKVSSLVHTSFAEQNPDVSPDGRWITYQSSESGRLEIYVRPFPNVDEGRWQVSTSGGIRPMWSRTGRELFYIDGAVTPMRMMSVPVQTTPVFTAGRARALFDVPAFGENVPGRNYDVSADGQRFLVIKDETAQTAAMTATPFVAVLNFAEELKRVVSKK